MRARHIFLVASFLGLLPITAAAQASDPVAAKGGEPRAAIPPAPVGPTTLLAPTGTVSPGLTATSQRGDPSPGLGQRIAGFSLMGVGAAGLVIGTIFGLQVAEHNRDSDSICPTGQPCPSQSIAEYNGAVADAKISRAASLIGFGVGGVFVGVGTVLVLTAPRRDVSGVAMWLAPAVGSLGAGAAFGGTW